MLTYSFVDLGSDSLYEHLYKCIKNDIMSGQLKSGINCRRSEVLPKIWT